ncbi:MAG: DNA-binding protein WhiA [Firmicutes bacterium]|nr:DNA-binding protein WhiA [Bacillota bacterium]
MNFIDSIREEIQTQEGSEVARFVVDTFLRCASGSMKSGYHIEFSFDTYEESVELSEILAMFEMLPKLMGRNGKFIVYLKSGECVCSLLALMGATNSLMMLHNEIALRDVRNNSNRRANCDTANIAKQIEAAATQVEAIRKINVSSLSEKLRETAQARLAHPEASYEELAQILGITKSGVVNRLRKITEI